MLRRLLLLLALIVALPATARPACHDAAAPPAQAGMVAAGDHATSHGEHRRAQAAPHDCLGCIPPDMLLGARVAGAAVARAVVIHRAPAAFPPGEAHAPTPPPPKNA